MAKAIKEYEGANDVFGEKVIFDGLAAPLKAKGVDEDGVHAQSKEVDAQEEAFKVNKRGSTR